MLIFEKEENSKCCSPFHHYYSSLRCQTEKCLINLRIARSLPIGICFVAHAEAAKKRQDKKSRGSEVFARVFNSLMTQW